MVFVILHGLSVTEVFRCGFPRWKFGKNPKFGKIQKKKKKRIFFEILKKKKFKIIHNFGI